MLEVIKVLWKLTWQDNRGQGAFMPAHNALAKFNIEDINEALQIEMVTHHHLYILLDIIEYISFYLILNSLTD